MTVKCEEEQGPEALSSKIIGCFQPAAGLGIIQAALRIKAPLPYPSAYHGTAIVCIPSEAP